VLTNFGDAQDALMEGQTDL